MTTSLTPTLPPVAPGLPAPSAGVSASLEARIVGELFYNSRSGEITAMYPVPVPGRPLNRPRFSVLIQCTDGWYATLVQTSAGKDSYVLRSLVTGGMVSFQQGFDDLPSLLEALLDVVRSQQVFLDGVVPAICGAWQLWEQDDPQVARAARVMLAIAEPKVARQVTDCAQQMRADHGADAGTRP